MITMKLVSFVTQPVLSVKNVENKKPNKIGGLVMVAPRGCYFVSFGFSVTLMAVTFVAHYIHVWDLPIMPVVWEDGGLLHPQCKHTFTYITEPPQSRIEAF